MWMCACVYLHAYEHAHAKGACGEVRNQLVGVSFLLSPCRFWDLNRGH